MKTKTYHVKKLTNWEKNPRSISKENFARLKKLILSLGLFKDLVVCNGGTVIGGNMRLRALKSIAEDLAANGVKQLAESYDVPMEKVEAIAVMIAEGVPCKDLGNLTEEQMVEYALADNDRAGDYELEQLAELVMETPQLQLDNFRVDLSDVYTLDQVVAMVSSEVDLGYNMQQDKADTQRAVKYEIVFDSLEQKKEFYDLLKDSQEATPNLTIAEIIVQCLRK